VPRDYGEADRTSGVEQCLDGLNAKLDELLEWYKAVNFRAVKQALLDALPDTQKRVAYQLSTDGCTAEEISKLIQIITEHPSQRRANDTLRLAADYLLRQEISSRSHSVCCIKKLI
jgi:hypothetical protein